MNNLEVWGQWATDIHNAVNQQKRLKSAKSAACTPVLLDQTNGTGIFRGQYGTYQTSLSTCSCVDFSRYHLPCKHMYRLALELECLDGDFKSDTSQIVTPQKEGLPLSNVIKNIESLPEDAQVLLKWILSQITTKEVYAYVRSDSFDIMELLISRGIIIKKSDLRTLLSAYTRNELNERISTLNIPFKKNMKYENLCIWCLDNIPEHLPVICNDTATVIVSPSYQPVRSKLYKYLHRKFDTESFIDFSTMKVTSVPLLDTDLPSDIITEYLREYGYYKN